MFTWQLGLLLTSLYNYITHTLIQEKPIKRQTDKDQKKSSAAPPKKKKKMTMKSRQEDASSDDDSSSIGSYETDNGWCIRDEADGRDDETYEDSSSYIYEDEEEDDESGARFGDDYNTEDYDSDESTLTLTDVGMSGDGSNYSGKDSDEKDEDDDEEDDATTSDDSDATVSLASSGGDVAISKKQATIDECKPFAVQKKKSEGDDDSSMSGSGLSCWAAYILCPLSIVSWRSLLFIGIDSVTVVKRI